MKKAMPPLFLSLILAPDTLAVERLWAVARSASVDGSITVSLGENTTLTLSIKYAGHEMGEDVVPDVDGQKSGYSVNLSGVARGTYTYISTYRGEVLCRDSGVIDDEPFTLSYSQFPDGVGASFLLDNSRETSSYGCSGGPKEVDSLLGIMQLACSGAQVRRGDAKIDAPTLHIEQVTSSSCGSVTERAMIINEKRKEPDLP